MPKPSCTILVADDDDFIRDDLGDLLGKNPEYNVLYSKTAKETWETISAQPVNLVLLDLKFPDAQDLALLRRIRQERPGTEIVVLSSQTENVTQIVEAIKWGAYDFVAKPFSPAELANRIAKALQLQRLRNAHDLLVRELSGKHSVSSLIGPSASMNAVRNTISRVADLDGCVLVEGASGTGKELVARAIHFEGKRRDQPFVVVNCAAIPDSLVESTLFGHRKGAFTGAIENARGKFEAAGSGTVFLDEIGEMPLAQQAALLRVLEYKTFTRIGETQERECAARILLATNRDLREEVSRGRFREDLYYRIRVATIEIPPLASRAEDIPYLVAHYCERLSSEMGRSPVVPSEEVLQLFKAYDWPGNVRELKNLLEGIIMLLDPSQTVIEESSIPLDLLACGAEPATGNLSQKERAQKRDLIKALRLANGNHSRAARILKCHRNTVRTRIRSFGLSRFSVEDADEDEASAID
ncbi:MAG: sigma-54-dependent Fis family transcriptional regulator [Planctomycetes bacterium]|nr:sigma-54-dependent Fis family transcriptional regulator [Planctomycetota bacterium]